MKPVSIHIDKLYKNDLPAEDCKISVPFAKGILFEQDLPALRLLDPAAKTACPLQPFPVAFWPDRSIRYLMLYFQADIPGNGKKTLTLVKEEADAPVPTAGGSRILLSSPENEDLLAAKNGVLAFSLKNGSASLFENLSACGLNFSADQFEGPVLTVNGEELPFCIEKWREIPRGGSLSTVLEGDGFYEYEKADQGKLRCTVRITLHAGKPWIDTAVRLFNDTDGDLIPDSWTFAVKRRPDSSLDALAGKAGKGAGVTDSTGCGDMNKTLVSENNDTIYTTGLGELPTLEQEFKNADPGTVRSFTGISNYKTRFTISKNGNAVSNEITGPSLVGESNEHFAEVFYGTFFAGFGDGSGGVCSTIYQAHQNFPKAIRANREGILLFLIPESDEKVVFSSGMAREQRFLLHFYDGETPIEALDDRSLIYQMPVTPWIEPAVFGEADILPNLVTPAGKWIDEVEESLINRADRHGRAYGMMNWGDFPDMNYTAQGRGQGRLVWTNNEYDYPHAMFLMYMRTGVRRFLDYARTAALHWMDVDICHYSKDPLWTDGQWEHTAGHNGGSKNGNGAEGVMVCSHEWVEGLLDLWHLTGEDRAFASAVGIGENVLRLLETPMYQKPGEATARETGWALRTLTALYIETGEDRWLKKSQFIIRQFSEWNDRYGVWLAPYTDNTVIRVGFMISVAVGSLMRFYRVFPDQELKELILGAIDDLTENFMTPYGLFYYKELPSLMRNGNNCLLLESMYIGYELTGDRKYLEFGKKTFWNAIRDSSDHGGNKRVVEDAVLVGSGPTKSFAQSFLPLVQFYNAMIGGN